MPNTRERDHLSPALEQIQLTEELPPRQVKRPISHRWGVVRHDIVVREYQDVAAAASPHDRRRTTPGKECFADAPHQRLQGVSWERE